MYEIYDSHAHIYPNKIADKARDAIGDFYDLHMSGGGTTESLLREGSKIGVKRYIVHSVATVPHQVVSINNFIHEECNLHKEFIGFMTLHQGMTEEEIDDEVKRCISLGFYGIKLHPDFQHFRINSDEGRKLFSVVNGRLPILLHTGDKRYDYSHPAYMAEICRDYKGSRFIAAHFGGWSEWETAIDFYKGIDNVWFDTSSSLYHLDNGLATNLIRKGGVERFFFGSDYPMWNHEEELKRFLALDLNEREREDILGKNLKKFLNL